MPAGTVVLTVTGRAGGPGHYDYVVTQTSYSATSVLNDAYFSNYEVLDPNSDTIQGINVTSGGGKPPSQSVAIHEPSRHLHLHHERRLDDVSVWTAMCLYDTYDPNTFIDSLGLTISGTTYSASHPYYGPYQSASSRSLST